MTLIFLPTPDLNGMEFPTLIKIERQTHLIEKLIALVYSLITLKNQTIQFTSIRYRNYVDQKIKKKPLRDLAFYN